MLEGFRIDFMFERLVSVSKKRFNEIWANGGKCLHVKALQNYLPILFDTTFDSAVHWFEQSLDDKEQLMQRYTREHQGPIEYHLQYVSHAFLSSKVY